MKINASNYRLFNPQELRSYAEKGLLSFELTDDNLINECILYMLEGLYTEEQMKHAISVAFDNGYDEGYSHGLNEPDALWTTVK